MARTKSTFPIIAILVTGIAGCAELPEGDVSMVENAYAALAVVPARGQRFHGYARRPKAKEAKKAALEKCKLPSCVVVQSYEPGQCVHIVLGNDQIYWNNQNFSSGQKQAVLDFCQRIDDSCQVIVSECLR